MSLPHHAYEPREFWNRKARASEGDPVAAVCHSDPDENRNIAAIQRRTVGRALRRVRRGKPGERALDYGCGSGRWKRPLCGRGYGYTGVDLSEEMVRIARVGDPTGDFRVIDDRRGLPFPDGAFSLICSIAVLHHNPPPRQDGILAELVRVLSPDGALVLFESVGAPDPKNPVEYSRPWDEWIATLASLGMTCTWREGTRYFLLRTLVERVTPGGARSPTLRRGSLRAGSVTDPWLAPLLPDRFHERGAMIFRRRTGPG